MGTNSGDSPKIARTKPVASGSVGILDGGRLMHFHAGRTKCARQSTIWSGWTACVLASAVLCAGFAFADQPDGSGAGGATLPPSGGTLSPPVVLLSDDPPGCGGYIVELDDHEQGEGCIASIRPHTKDGDPAPLVITARTMVAPSAPHDPDAAGEPGAVDRQDAGFGVKSASCAGSSGINGSGGQADEELIIAFDAPIPAAALIIKLREIDFSQDDPVIFLSSASAAGFDHTLLEPAIQAAFTATGGQRGVVTLAEVADLPAGLEIDIVKIRETRSRITLTELVVLADCDDDNPCTVDHCVNGSCQSTPSADGTPCSDGLFCNGLEVCQAGACVDSPDPCANAELCDEGGKQCMECASRADCDDENVCTTDVCREGSCLHVNNDGPCDDGNACTTGESCDGGLCRGGVPVVCDDHNVCTIDFCDLDTGCAFLDIRASCDDDDPCTIDSCNEALGCQNVPDTAPCNDGTPACDDCNLNGIRDLCDINSGVLADDDHDGVPDDCSQFDGACTDNPTWSCPGNWNLGGDIPNNSPFTSYAVTLDHNDDVLLDLTVNIDSLRLLDNSILRVTNPGTEGNLKIVTDGGLLNEGVILTGGNRIIDLTCGPVTVRNGSYIPDPGAPPGTLQSVLNCETLTVGSGGIVQLDGQMVINASVDVVLDGSGAAPCTEDGGKSPPILGSRGLSSIQMVGNLTLIGSSSLVNQTVNTLRIGGNFDNRNTTPQCFDSSVGRIVMQGGGAQLYEVSGQDFGASSVGFTHPDGHTNYSVGILEITGGGPTHRVTFRNSFLNAYGAGACGEALYVGLLVLKPGSSIVVDNVHVYYSALIDEGGTVTTLGCGALLQAQQACVASVDCDDANPCTNDACEGLFCDHDPVAYGNVNGTGPTQPNLDDILCVLQGFANYAACPNANIAPCVGAPPTITIDDILAILAAFSGGNPCGCVL